MAEQGFIKILVSVEVPTLEETNFTGQIKIVNTDNSSDFEIINITLSTAKIKGYSLPRLIQVFRFLEQRFPFFEKILNQYYN